MLRAAEGATVSEIVTATNWQPHTVRGAMAGSLKKKLGLEVTSEKVENVGESIVCRPPESSAARQPPPSPGGAFVLVDPAVPACFWSRGKGDRNRA